jgi:hypothetical protein
MKTELDYLNAKYSKLDSDFSKAIEDGTYTDLKNIEQEVFELKEELDKSEALKNYAIFKVMREYKLSQIGMIAEDEFKNRLREVKEELKISEEERSGLEVA